MKNDVNSGFNERSQAVNYILHLNSVFLQFQKDNRLNPTHISLYMALFQLWNYNRFPEQFQINREEVMKLSKIGSKTTYHRNLKELSHFGYTLYVPSHNPFKGSRIHMPVFGTTHGRAVNLPVPNSEQAVGPIYKHTKTLKTNKKETKSAKPKNEQVVIDFFKKSKWPIVEAQKFFNHYESNGWKIGGATQMFNWRASAKKWMLNATELKQNKQQSQFLDNPHFQHSSTTKGVHTREEDSLHTTRDKNYNQPL